MANEYGDPAEGFDEDDDDIDEFTLLATELGGSTMVEDGSAHLFSSSGFGGGQGSMLGASSGMDMLEMSAASEIAAADGNSIGSHAAFEMTMGMLTHPEDFEDDDDDDDEALMAEFGLGI